MIRQRRQRRLRALCLLALGGIVAAGCGDPKPLQNVGSEPAPRRADPPSSSAKKKHSAHAHAHGPHPHQGHAHHHHPHPHPHLDGPDGHHHPY